MSSSASVPALVSLSTLLKAGKLPKVPPLIFITNSQWRRWEKTIKGKKARARTLVGDKATKSKAAPKVLAEIIPLPSAGGYVVSFIGKSKKSRLTMWRSGSSLSDCVYVGYRRSESSSGNLENWCGRCFSICEEKFVCVGECEPVRAPGIDREGPPYTVYRDCLPDEEIIPEQRIVISCHCMMVRIGK